MIQDTIQQIEARLNEQLPAEKRAELVKLLGTLKQEVQELSKTDADQARSIAGFAQVSAHEATRSEPNPTALQHALAGLQSSVEGFEETHPRLVQAVNSVCTALSNLGI
jgi:hypothetical protein